MTGDEIRTVRNQLGLTQAELAALLEVPTNTLARWERSEVTIQHPRILRLALERLQQRS